MKVLKRYPAAKFGPMPEGLELEENTTNNGGTTNGTGGTNGGGGTEPDTQPAQIGYYQPLNIWTFADKNKWFLLTGLIIVIVLIYQFRKK